MALILQIPLSPMRGHRFNTDHLRYEWLTKGCHYDIRGTSGLWLHRAISFDVLFRVGCARDGGLFNIRGP